MEIFELIQQSQTVARMVWDAVKVANPQEMGMYMRHPDVAEGDHEYAKSIVWSEPKQRIDFQGELVTPTMVFTARDLVNFLQRRTGWGSELSSNGRGDDVELGIASMIQYQNQIRKHQIGIVGERAEAGMEKLLANFACAYPVSQPERAIETVREKLDPLFEDGLRLSDHQRMFGGFAPDDPHLDQLARQIVGTQQATERATDMEQRNGRLSRQPVPAPAVRSGPRADDPWEMHP